MYPETDSEARAAMASSRKARAKAHTKLKELQNKLPAPAPAPFLSSHETEEEILSIIERVAYLRTAAHPDTFERLWDAHIERAYELDDADLEEQQTTEMRNCLDESSQPAVVEGETSSKQAGQDTPMKDASVEKTTRFGDPSNPGQPSGETAIAISSTVAPLTFPVNLVSNAQIRSRLDPNYSNEPFHTSGNPTPPSLSQIHRLSPALPGYMSIYITTSPPHFAYHDRAYHHPAAPVAIQNQVAFFQQVMERAERIVDQDVLGYAFSYGWCDVSRWIEKTLGHGCRGSGDGREAGESEGREWDGRYFRGICWSRRRWGSGFGE